MKFDRKYLLALFPLIFLILIFYFFTDIVIYIILAWVLSMLGAPMMKLLRKIFPRNTSAILTLTSFLLAFVLLTWLFVPPIVHQTRNLASVDYESLLTSLEEPIDDWNNWLIDRGLMKGNPEPNPVDTAEIADDQDMITEVIRLDSLLLKSGDTSKIQPIALIIHLKQDNPNQVEASKKDSEIQDSDSFFDRFRKSLINFLDPSVVTGLFGSLFGFFGNMLVAVMSIFFIAFFFLREQGLFIDMLSAIVPNEYENQIVRAVTDTSNLLVRYFIGIAFQITIITIFVTVILSILGIKNALLIGFFAALMNVIPYLGPVVGAAFGVIITVSSNLEIPFYAELLPMLTKVIIVFAIMQLLDNIILQPNIFSKSVKAHPLEIFIVVLAAAKLGGILGMVLAIPAYTVLRVVARVFLSEFKIVQRITRGM